MDNGLLDRVLVCTFERWNPVIGDPTVMGWVTVAAYLLSAAVALSVAAGGAFGRGSARRERLFWVMLAVLMVALAVNKQLDLQSFITAMGRCSSQIQGWYAHRRPIQLAFVLGLGLTTVAIGLVLLVWLRGTLRRTGIAHAGLVFITAFVLVRAVGFTHVDRIINFDVSGVRMNWVLELAGLGLILIGGGLHPRARVRDVGRSARPDAPAPGSAAAPSARVPRDRSDR